MALAPQPQESPVNAIQTLPDLEDDDVRVFSLLCEQALAVGDLRAPIDLHNIASEPASESLNNVLRKSLTVLIEGGYLDRAGSQRYAVTTAGFQLYARSYIEDYGRRESAVLNAVAAVDGTDTVAVMASTGETQLMVNHFLSLLQRDRSISGFVTESKGYCVTRVSPAFKRDRASLKAAE
jgi:hypothetical protein